MKPKLCADKSCSISHISSISRSILPLQQGLVDISPSSLNTAVRAVALRLIELLVESLRPPLDGPAQQHRTQAAEQDQASSKAVEGLLRRGKEVRREPVRALTDAVGNGDECSFLASRCRHQRRLPGQLQIEPVVRAADEEHCAKVARADVRGADHDRDADG